LKRGRIFKKEKRGFFLGLTLRGFWLRKEEALTYTRERDHQQREKK